MTKNKLVIDKILDYHREFNGRERMNDHRKMIEKEAYHYVTAYRDYQYDFEEYLEEETNARPSIIHYLICQLEDDWDGLRIVVNFALSSLKNESIESYFEQALKEILSLDPLKEYHSEIKQIYQVWLKLKIKRNDQVFDQNDRPIKFREFSEWLLAYQTCWDGKGEYDEENGNLGEYLFDYDYDIKFSTVYQKFMSD